MVRRLALLAVSFVVAGSMYSFVLGRPAVTFSALGTPTSQVYLPIVAKPQTLLPGNVTISIKRPAQNAYVGDSLQVAVIVNSLYELRTVRATVESRATNLVFTDPAYCEGHRCQPGWTGIIPMVGLSRGGKTLTVTAIDAFGNSGSATGLFIYDRPPVLSATAPISDTVARPQLRVTASCTDDDPAGCASIEIRVASYMCDGAVILSGQSSIDATISLAAYDGQEIRLCFVAFDSVGQQTSESRTIFVESSTKLSEVETVAGRIWDVQTDRILFSDSSGVLKVRDRISRQDTSIPPIAGKVPQYGFLTPSGAIFVAQAGVYDWSNGTLLDLGLANSDTSLRVSGRYAIWNGAVTGGQVLYLRDLLSGTNTTVSTDAGNWGNDVAANGDVVFWSNQHQVYRYRGGVTTQLTNDASLWNVYPSTDGINVVYRKFTPDGYVGNETCAIVMYGAPGEVTLAPACNPAIDYQPNNGWIAFTDLGTEGQWQVWTRSPAGEKRQASFFASSSRIDALGGNGEVTFFNENRLYLASGYPGFIDIGSSLGRSLWQNGDWYVIIGRSLFRVVR